MSPAPAAPPARRHRAARSAGGAGRICLPHPRCMALLAGSGHHRQRARPGRRLHERLHERDGRRRIAVADGGRRRQLVRRAPPTAHSPAQPAPSVRHADSARCCLRSRRSGANQTLFPAASSGARLEGEDEAAVSSAAGDGGADPVRRPPLAPRPSPLLSPTQAALRVGVAVVLTRVRCCFRHATSPATRPRCPGARCVPFSPPRPHVQLPWNACVRKHRSSRFGVFSADKLTAYVAFAAH